jgi:uncharacterized membrane protein (DUF2068 family)
LKRTLPATYRGRPIGLVAIVLYKLIITLLFAITAVAVLLTLKNYALLEAISANYELAGKHQLITWALDKILNLSPKAVKFSGFAAAGYSLLSGIEAYGLWRGKAWAHVLVLVLVGISIPPELYEIARGITLIKVLVCALNVAVFAYLFSHRPQHHVRRHDS